MKQSYWKIIFFCCMVALCGVQRASAQNYEKIVVDNKDSVSGYYLALKPFSDIKGVLFLLEGFGGRPEGIFVESRLPQVAFANGYLTIAAGMGNKVYADSTVIRRLNLVFRDVLQRYNVSKDAFVMGGFSAGGTVSLRYVQLCKESPSSYPINPRAVFSVDAPVDLFELWDNFKKSVAKNYSDMAVNEARFVSDLMQREHGSPETNRTRYLWLSPFNEAQKEPGNERFLKDIPVRVYHDVDIPWRLVNRRQSGYESNFLTASEMILRLLLLKNERAEFVTGRPGYRVNGMRHPHSWNIVDEVEFLLWMNKVLEK